MLIQWTIQLLSELFAQPPIQSRLINGQVYLFTDAQEINFYNAQRAQKKLEESARKNFQKQCDADIEKKIISERLHHEKE